MSVQYDLVLWSKIQGNVVPELSNFPFHEYIEGVGVKFHVTSSSVLEDAESS
jgi:hypothetical protein